MANNFPTPPPDASGGVLVIGYGNALGTHHVRVHIPPFDTTTVPTAPNFDRAYSPTGVGDNNSVRQTAISLIDKLKGYYFTAYSFFTSALYTRDPTTGGLVQVFPVPVVNETGTDTTGDLGPTDAARFIASTYTLHTVAGGRWRCSLVGAAARPLSKPARISTAGGGIDFLYGGAGGSALDVALHNYLVGAATVNGFYTAIVGHDGQKLAGTAQLTMSMLSRQRREAGFTGLSRAQT